MSFTTNCDLTTNNVLRNGNASSICDSRQILPMLHHSSTVNAVFTNARSFNNLKFKY